MTNQEFFWEYHLGLLSPVILNGIDRRSNVKHYDNNIKALAKAQNRRNITKEALEEINKAIEPLIHKHYFDSHVYAAVKDHKSMYRPDGTRYAERTVLLYIFRLRKKLGVKKPENTTGMIIKLLAAGHPADDIAIMTGARLEYVKEVRRRENKKHLLNNIKKC